MIEAICLWRQDVLEARAESTLRPLTREDLQPPHALGKAPAPDGRDGGRNKPTSNHPSDMLLQASMPEKEGEGHGEGDNPCFGEKYCREGLTGPRQVNNAGKPCTHKLAGGSGSPRKLTRGGAGDGRVAKGRWVVTMMVPGRKLWGSSPAMVSQYKRFRRSRQEPKIARDQVWRMLTTYLIGFCVQRKP